MDSVNSGMSLQSSSGAEEECDSQATASTTTTTTTTITTNIYQPHQPPLPPFNHHIYNSSNLINNPNPNPTFFPPTPQHQLDSVIWSKTLLPSFSQATTTHEPITPMPTLNLNPNPKLNPHSVPAKNPKKRTRASRKAPTTVLTTDTTNFRAMVQEFTGIPAPPFASPLYPRLSTTSSFDLFGRPSFLSSSMPMRSSNNNYHHHLFDNPFPQIMFQSSSSSTSSLLDNYSMQQNTITFPTCNSHNQLSAFHQDPKTIQNVGSSNHLFDDDMIGRQPQILELPTSTSINDQVASDGNVWDGNRKESSGVKGDQGFIEPWICSSD